MSGHPSRALPEGLENYARTKEFTHDTLPKSIAEMHNTKEGVWGRLNVLRGEVQYFLSGDDSPLATIHGPGSFVILPTERHYVRMSKDAAIFVEFFREPRGSSATTSESSTV